MIHRCKPVQPSEKEISLRYDSSMPLSIQSQEAGGGLFISYRFAGTRHESVMRCAKPLTIHSHRASPRHSKLNFTQCHSHADCPLMTTPRLPESSDFPPSLTYTLIPSATPPAKPSQNLLILIHGLGDTHTPFATLGSNFNLPETACLAIRGPTPLPFEITGFHWGDDIIFDQSTGGLDGDSGFKRTQKLLREVVEDTLVKKCGWDTRRIFFLGFGQGGMVALDVPAGAKNTEYGGAISIGGVLPSDSEKPEKNMRSKTPVLLLGAEKNSAIDAVAEKKVRGAFEFVQVVKWSGRNGDGMMETREEARPIMEFFGRRLGSRAGVPEGAVEL